jgi:hypothetical protein
MLCSHEQDIEHEIYLFFNRLLDRGYSLPTLIPLFLNAEQKARKRRVQQLHRQQNLCTGLPQNTRYTASEDGAPLDSDSVFLHLRYHPSNPSSQVIQKLWRQHMLLPMNEPPLFHLKNRAGFPVEIRRLIIAYSRAPNLGNMLSCRKITTKTTQLDTATDTSVLEDPRL